MAALGLAGSSTAIAKRTTTRGDSVLANFDDDSVVEWDEDAWPQEGYDNGETSYNAAGSGPTGELSEAWRFGDEERSRDAQRPIVSNGTVYTFKWDYSGDPVQKLYALDREGGTEQWSAELTTTYGTTYEGTEGPISEYLVHGTAVADGVVYLSRWEHTIAFDADNGERLWSVEHGGDDISVTDESLVVDTRIDEDHDERTAAKEGRVLALSREDGSIRWRRTFQDAGLDPVVADGSVYVRRGNDDDSGEVYSLSLADGTTEWSREFDQLDGEPIATDDTLYVLTESNIDALDTETGDTRWKYDAYDSSDFVTVHAVGGGLAYITFGPEGDLELVAVDTATGDERWRMETVQIYDLVVVGGVLYYTIGGEDGRDDTTDDLLVLRNPSSGELLTKRTLPGTGDEEDGRYDAPKALSPVGGMLYMTADDTLIAFRDESDDDSDDSDDGTGEDDESNENDSDDGNGGDDGTGDEGSDDSDDSC